MLLTKHIRAIQHGLLKPLSSINTLSTAHRHTRSRARNLDSSSRREKLSRRVRGLPARNRSRQGKEGSRGPYSRSRRG